MSAEQEQGHPCASKEPSSAPAYLDAHALAAHTGFSKSTIERLRRRGRIPFFQPGGPGTKVMYPRNAIEHLGYVETAEMSSSLGQAQIPHRGPKPKWQQGPR